MIRTLQRKFVFTAMAAITVLILFLLGAINGANLVIVGEQGDRTLRVVAQHQAEKPPQADVALILRHSAPSCLMIPGRADRPAPQIPPPGRWPRRSEG